MATQIGIYDKNNEVSQQAQKNVTGDSIGTITSLHTVRQRDLLKSIYEESDTITYSGFAAPGTETSEALWRISRTVVSGNTTTTDWADGDTKFDNVWDDHATLDYS